MARWTRRVEPERYFTEHDRELIRQAASRAEQHTAGEVVPFVVGRCDNYREADWAGCALGATLLAMTAGTLHTLGGFWGGSPILWISLPVILGAGVGFALVRWLPAARRLMVPAGVLAQRVERRAALAFLEEEVFATRERTGILLLLALFERRVVVLADAGINAKVEQREWNDIVAALREGILQRRAAASFAEAISACGRLLEERDVEIRPDDVNEIRDHLRMFDE